MLPRPAILAFLLIMFFSGPFVLVERTQSTLSNPYSFISPKENEAIQFLNTQKPGIILVDKQMGGIISWKTNHKLVFGIGLMSYNREEKGKDLHAFCSGDYTMIDKYKPDFIWIKVNTVKKPSTDLTHMIFSNSEIEIYQIKK